MLSPRAHLSSLFLTDGGIVNEAGALRSRLSIGREIVRCNDLFESAILRYSITYLKIQ